MYGIYLIAFLGISRFVHLEGPGVSSSEEGSGIARFFPFGSLTGSLIVKGRLLRRVLFKS